MPDPRATVRLQLHAGFTFADASAQVPYFAALGISHLYLSPIFAARAGSTHGYDGIDFTRVSPVLGGERGLRALARRAHRAGLGLLVDFVPNHMAAHEQNAWWRDVLARGRASRHARFFDIDWNAPGLEDRVLLPILGSTPARALADGQLRAGNGALRYFDRKLPWPGRYELAHWREANARINWRRFFDLPEYAALRMEDPVVFRAVHAALLALWRAGVIDGVRLDHVDGLADPGAYCRALRRSLQRDRPAWLVVEKILGRGERLPRDWRSDGTTGYDFMQDAGALLHDPRGARPLSALWREMSGSREGFDAVQRGARRELAPKLLAADIDRYLREANGSRARLLGQLERFKVYRTYGKHPARFEQITAPLAAKAVEDTAFYRYGRLLSRNEVGSDPGVFSMTPAAFHAACARRARDFPRGLLATATHDHKRGEDARARLAVLSEMPARWASAVRRWRRLASRLRGPHGPSPADEYMLFQSAVGHWAGNNRGLTPWFMKAIREAKVHTSWTQPDAGYERDCERYANALPRALRKEIEGFVAQVAAAGAANGLAQTLLRLTAPGVPDLYQGCELWDFSFVDPDNRRPVDYALRARSLRSRDSFAALLDRWQDGAVKQRLIARALAHRAQAPALYGAGSYLPLASGARRRCIAYARTHGADAVIAVAAIRCADWIDPRSPRIAPRLWGSASLRLPPRLRGREWVNLLDGRRIAGGRSVSLAEAFGGATVALLAAP